MLKVGWGAALLVGAGLMLTGCGGAGVPAAAPAEDEKPPAPAKYIEGDWRCLISGDYTFHLRVTASSVSVGQGEGGEELHWTQYDYDLTTDGTLTTYPEAGGEGWVIQIPEKVVYGETNSARIAEGWTQNIEATASPNQLTWTDAQGEDWTCDRGTFKDDGNTFVEG